MRGDSKSPLSVNLLLLLTSRGLLVPGSQQELAMIIDPDSQEEVGLLFHNSLFAQVIHHEGGPLDKFFPNMT